MTYELTYISSLNEDYLTNLGIAICKIDNHTYEKPLQYQLKGLISTDDQNTTRDEELAQFQLSLMGHQ